MTGENKPTIKVLNLYAGIGGNRKLWENVEVTAVEINKDIAKISLDKIRINSIGLYIAELKNNEVRLSIEGSQIIGPKAKKNVIELEEKNEREWLKGRDIELKTKEKGFVILKNKDNYLGSGKVKQNNILNFIPKIRRLNVSD